MNVAEIFTGALKLTSILTCNTTLYLQERYRVAVVSTLPSTSGSMRGGRISAANPLVNHVVVLVLVIKFRLLINRC